MKRRILSLLAAVMLIGMVGAGPVAAEGSCLVPHSSVDKIAAMKYYTDVLGNSSGSRFDYVEGSATTQDLDECSGNGKGSQILPANIQTDNHIYQLGYDEHGGARRFVYAFENKNAIYISSGPTIGRSYQYSITLTNDGLSDMQVNYKIIDKTANPDVTVYNVTRTVTNHEKGWLAWWGAERQETESSIGNDHNDPSINVRIMKYRLANSATITQRTNINASAICENNNAAPTCHIVRSAAFNGSTTQHFHVGNDNYTNDQIDFDNTAN